MIQIFVGIVAEGSTDYRFLQPIVEKTLNDIAFDCTGQVDTYVNIIECDKGTNFTEYVLHASANGYQKYGIMMLIVHTDADSLSSKNAYKHKIDVAKEELSKESEKTHCKNIVALVPIQETESWMLADKNLLMKQIGTKKSETELNISGHPETFNNPKERIEEAIRIGRAGMSKKLKSSLKISDLYAYIGGAIKLDKLKNFASFQDFEHNLRSEFIKLKLLKPNDLKNPYKSAQK